MNRKAGYSLFEVLVAFAIMAMVLTVLLPRQTLLLQRSVGLQDRAMARELALSDLARLGTELPLQPGLQDLAYGEWTLRRNISAREQIGDKDAFDVKLEVLDAGDRILTELSVIKVVR